MYSPPDDEAGNNICSRMSFGLLLCLVGLAVGFCVSLRFLPQPFNLVAGMIAVLLIAASAIAFAWRLMMRKGGPVDELRPAGRRYTRRFLPAMMVYVVVFFAATWFYKLQHPAGVEAVLMALAPSVPILFAIRALMLFLKEETDEYLRSRMLESWALATGGALAICTVYGFLDLFRVAPHIQLWAVFPVWALCLFPAQWLLNRRT